MITARGMMDYLREHPEASNKEIAEVFGADDTTVRTLICRHKGKGELEDTGENGVRHLIVHKEPEKQKYDYKKSMLMDMCDTYYLDFQKAELYSERVEIGKMICRILEKI